MKERVDVLFDALSDIPNIKQNKPQGVYTMVELPVLAEDFAHLIHDFRDNGESLVVAPELDSMKIPNMVKPDPIAQCLNPQLTRNRNFGKALQAFQERNA